jgi:hypothetical protein
MTAWLLGILAGFFALLGAVLAAGAIDTGMFTFGLGLAGFGVLFVFWLIKDHFDAAERSRAASEAS